MPTTDVSPIFQVVQAAEQFKAELGEAVGRRYDVGGEELTLGHDDRDLLSRYSLSIGTPPVTEGIRDLVSGMFLGRPLGELQQYVDFLGGDQVELEELLRLVEQLVTSSLHYCTAAEERAFLREAIEFVNFEGGRIFNRVVITESPDRVSELIQRHLFDKFGAGDEPPVRLVPGEDGLDRALIQEMRAEPNQIFVVLVTRIPHSLFAAADQDKESWRSVLGRLVLIDASRNAWASNTTVVYTLFPHVARTLRNIQTRLAGRPANTQLQLRRILERFQPEGLAAMRETVEEQLRFMHGQGALELTVEEIRVHEWRRHGLRDYLAMAKLHRLLAFLEVVAAGSAEE